MPSSELIGQVEGPDTPLLRLSFTSTLSVIALTSLLIDNSLCIFKSHGAWSSSLRSRSLCLIGTSIGAEMIFVSLILLVKAVRHISHVSLLLVELGLINLTIDSLRCSFSEPLLGRILASIFCTCSFRLCCSCLD